MLTVHLFPRGSPMPTGPLGSVLRSFLFIVYIFGPAPRARRPARRAGPAPPAGVRAPHTHSHTHAPPRAGNNEGCTLKIKGANARTRHTGPSGLGLYTTPPFTSRRRAGRVVERGEPAGRPAARETREGEPRAHTYMCAQLSTTHASSPRALRALHPSLRKCRIARRKCKKCGYGVRSRRTRLFGDQLDRADAGSWQIADGGATRKAAARGTSVGDLRVHFVVEP